MRPAHLIPLLCVLLGCLCSIFVMGDRYVNASDRGNSAVDDAQNGFSLVAPQGGATVLSAPTFQWNAGPYDAFLFYSVFYYAGYGYKPVKFWYLNTSLTMPDTWWKLLGLGKSHYWVVLGANTITKEHEVSATWSFKKAKCGTDADCDDGTWCNGQERCDAVNGCQAGTPPDCSDGVACTVDSCSEASDSCEYLCAAAGFGDLCCDDLACAYDPICEFPGNNYMVRVTDLSEQPGTCLFGGLSWLLPTIGDLLAGIVIPVSLPPESEYPTLLVLPVPILGELEVTARFINDEIVFDPVHLAPIDLAQSVSPYLPPDLMPIVNAILDCLVETTADGWTDGLTPDQFGMTIRGYDLTVSDGSGTGECSLNRPAPGSDCTLIVTLEGSIL